MSEPVQVHRHSSILLCPQGGGELPDSRSSVLAAFNFVHWITSVYSATIDWASVVCQALSQVLELQLK